MEGGKGKGEERAVRGRREWRVGRGWVEGKGDLDDSFWEPELTSWVRGKWGKTERRVRLFESLLGRKGPIESRKVMV